MEIIYSKVSSDWVGITNNDTVQGGYCVVDSTYEYADRIRPVFSGTYAECSKWAEEWANEDF